MRDVRFVWMVLLVLVVTAGWAQAQDRTPVPAGQALTAEWSHDGANVAGFRCVVDGTEVASVAASARSCSVPAQADGDHTLVVEAHNQFGKASMTVPFVAGRPPGAPSNPRIRVETTTAMTIEIPPDGVPRVVHLETQSHATRVAASQ